MLLDMLHFKQPLNVLKTYLHLKGIKILCHVIPNLNLIFEHGFYFCVPQESQRIALFVLH